VNLDAEPEAITFDTAQTAVLVVDMQNDFGSKGGMFDRAGIDISGIQKAVDPTARVLAAARKAGIKIIYLKMGYKPDLSDLGAPDSVNRVRHLRAGVGEKVVGPDGQESRILIRDTWNTEIVAELKPEPDDDVIYKTRFSGFFRTDLDARLKRLGVKSLIITGCTTSICVDSTVRDAMFRDYLCVLLADCMSEPIGHGLPRSNHDAFAPERRGVAGLGLGLRTVPEVPPAVNDLGATRPGASRRPGARLRRSWKSGAAKSPSGRSRRPWVADSVNVGTL
jgi:ureidoacrylate peracid hydrolase